MKIEKHKVESLVCQRYPHPDKRNNTHRKPKSLSGLSSSLFLRKYAPICLLAASSLWKGYTTHSEILRDHFVQSNRQNTNPPQPERTFNITAFVDFPISASYFDSGTDLQLMLLTKVSKPDYDGLEFQSLVEAESFQRNISERDKDRYNKERAALLKYMEKHDLQSKEAYDSFDDLDFPRKCVRPQWTYKVFQNCLNVHAITYDRSPQHSLQDYKLEYLASGGYREAIRFTPVDGTTPFVMKSKIYKRSLDQKDVHKINTETLVMERLSASKVTSDIYAHCGTTVVVQSGHDFKKELVPKIGRNHRGRLPQEDLDKLQVNDAQPMNNYTISEKVDMALAMAESLAETHGYEGGVIVNDDITLGQWLKTEDGSIILNDFNNAMYMAWNLEKQSYCKYYRSFKGTFNAPEENGGSWVDESVDVWPMGNVIFAILTGLHPYYEHSDSKQILKKIKQSPPYIDPRYKTRSYAEGRMVEIMNQCHKLKPSERVDIFEVVRHLRETKRVMSLM